MAGLVAGLRGAVGTASRTRLLHPETPRPRPREVLLRRAKNPFCLTGSAARWVQALPEPPCPVASSSPHLPVSARFNPASPLLGVASRFSRSARRPCPRGRVAAPRPQPPWHRAPTTPTRRLHRTGPAPAPANRLPVPALRARASRTGPEPCSALSPYSALSPFAGNSSHPETRSPLRPCPPHLCPISRPYTVSP